LLSDGILAPINTNFLSEKIEMKKFEFYFSTPKITIKNEKVRQNAQSHCCSFIICESKSGKDWKIEIKHKKDGFIFNYHYFRNVRMNAVGENEFELCAFPIRLKYIFKDDSVYISVSGSHLYYIVGETLKKIG
jgi:hypothetical protein